MVGEQISDIIRRNEPAAEPELMPLKTLTDALHAKAAEQDAILTLYRTGRISADALDRQLSAIQAEEIALKREADFLAAKHQAKENAKAAASDAAVALRQIVRKLEPGVDMQALPWETRRHIVESLVQEIRIGTYQEPGKKRQPDITVTYRFLEETPPEKTEKTSIIYDTVRRAGS